MILDVSGLEKNVAGKLRATPTALAEGAFFLMQPVMREIVENTPVDTGRLKRGYAMAANAVGLGHFSEPELRPSRYRSTLIERLEHQVIRYQKSVIFWEKIIRTRYTERNRGGRWLRDAQRKLATAEKRLNRSIEELAKFVGNDLAIVIFRAAKNGLTVTVREKVHGGTGRILRGDDFAGYEIRNLEPHARIIESRNHVVKNALDGAKSAGVRRASRAYIERVKSA